MASFSRQDEFEKHLRTIRQGLFVGLPDATMAARNPVAPTKAKPKNIKTEQLKSWLEKVYGGQIHPPRTRSAAIPRKPLNKARPKSAASQEAGRGDPYEALLNWRDTTSSLGDADARQASKQDLLYWKQQSDRLSCVKQPRSSVTQGLQESDPPQFSAYQPRSVRFIRRHDESREELSGSLLASPRGAGLVSSKLSDVDEHSDDDGMVDIDSEFSDESLPSEDLEEDLDNHDSALRHRHVVVVETPPAFEEERIEYRPKDWQPRQGLACHNRPQTAPIRREQQTIRRSKLVIAQAPNGNVRPQRRIASASRFRPPPPLAATVTVDDGEAARTKDEAAALAIRRKRGSKQKIFIICGSFQDIREGLVRRGWCENSTKDSRVFDFKWTLYDNDVGYKDLKRNQIVNHFQGNCEITSKGLLCRNLRNCVWAMDLDPDTVQPKCFEVSDSTEWDSFVASFHLSAIQGVLCMYAERQSNGTEGAWPISKLHLVQAALALAKERMYRLRYEDSPHQLQNGWVDMGGVAGICGEQSLIEEVLELFYSMRDVFRSKNGSEQVDMGGKHFSAAEDPLTRDCKQILHELRIADPQFLVNGMQGVWIAKAANSSKGVGIKLFDRLSQAMDSKGTARVLQKYVERPFLIASRKFDIRCWVLVTDWNPLSIWFYQDCILRFCSEPWNLSDVANRFAHLSNVSVNKVNFREHDSFQQVWASWTLADHLAKETGRPDIWEKEVLPAIKHLVVASLRSAQNEIRNRKGSFELYGFDVLLDESLHPWLLEINLSPDLRHTTAVKASMSKALVEDMLALIVDIGFERLRRVEAVGLLGSCQDQWDKIQEAIPEWRRRSSEEGANEGLDKEGYDESMKEEAQKDGQENGPSSPSSSENMRREHGWCLIFRDGTESEGREGGDLSLAVEGQKMSNRAMRNFDIFVDRQLVIANVLTIQRRFRKFLERKRFQAHRRSSKLVSTRCKACFARRRFVRLIMAGERLKISAKRTLQLRFYILLSSALRLQRAWKGFKARACARRKAACVLQLQALGRGFLARRFHRSVLLLANRRRKEEGREEEEEEEEEARSAPRPRVFLPFLPSPLSPRLVPSAWTDFWSRRSRAPEHRLLCRRFCMSGVFEFPAAHHAILLLQNKVRGRAERHKFLEAMAVKSLAIAVRRRRERHSLCQQLACSLLLSTIKRRSLCFSYILQLRAVKSCLLPSLVRFSQASSLLRQKVATCLLQARIRRLLPCDRWLKLSAALRIGCFLRSCDARRRVGRIRAANSLKVYMRSALQRRRWERREGGRRILLLLRRWMARSDLERRRAANLLSRLLRRRRDQEQLQKRKAAAELQRRTRTCWDRKMWMKGKQAIVLLSAQLRRLEVTSWKSKETQAARVLQHGWICYMSRRFFRRLRELQAREVESRLRGERQRRSGRTGQQEGRGKERTRSQLNEGKEEEACKPGLPLPATISKLRLRQSFRLNLELLKGGGKSSLADNEEGKDVEVVLRAANEQVEQSYKKFLEKRRSGSEEKEKGGKDRKRKEEKGGRRMEVPEEEREKMAGGRETERAESRSSSLRLRERVAALSALYDEPEKREEAGLQLGNVSAREELDSPASSSSSRRSSSRAASPKKWTQTRPQEMRDSTALLDAFLEVPTPRTTRSMRTKTKTTGAWDSEGLYSILDFVGKDRLGGAAAARGGGGAGGGGGGGGGGRLYKRSQSAKTRRNEAGAAERFALKLAEMKQEEASAGNLKQANPYEEPMKRSFAVRPYAAAEGSARPRPRVKRAW